MSHRPSRLGPRAIRYVRVAGPGSRYIRYEGWNEVDQQHWQEVSVDANIPRRGPGEAYNGRRKGGHYSPAIDSRFIQDDPAEDATAAPCTG